MPRQRPVVSARVEQGGGLLPVSALEVCVVNETAERLIGERQAALYLTHLFGRKDGLGPCLGFVEGEDGGGAYERCTAIPARVSTEGVRRGRSDRAQRVNGDALQPEPYE